MGVSPGKEGGGVKPGGGDWDGDSVAPTVLAQALQSCARAGRSRVVLSQLDGTGVGGLKHHSWIEVSQLDHSHTAGVAEGSE